METLTYRGITLQQDPLNPGIPVSNTGDGTYAALQDAMIEVAKHGGDPDGMQVLTAGATTITVAECGGVMKKSRLTFSALPVSIDATGAAIGFGGSLLATFPVGIVQIHAVAIKDLILTEGATLDAADEGDFSIGTTVCSDATLTGTDVNLIASTSIAPIATAVDAVSAGAGLNVDGTAAAATLYLNVLIDDDDIGTVTEAMTAAGVVDVLWSFLGNDA